VLLSEPDRGSQAPASDNGWHLSGTYDGREKAFMSTDLGGRFAAEIKPPPRNQIDYFDTEVSGLGLRVSAGGKKTWFLMYRHCGRRRRLTLSSSDALEAAKARKLAKRKLSEVAMGTDPAAERRAAREAESFAELATLYMEKHARPNKRSWREDQKMLDYDLLPVWRHMKAAEITRRDVNAVLDTVASRGAVVRANRVRALVSKIFNFAISRDIVEHNPVQGVMKPADETRRDRMLSEREIEVLWRELNSEPSKIAAIFKMALLTAQRKTEVLGMTWDELDLENGWWVLPAHRAKNGLAHRVPLESQAVRILRDIKKEANDPVFVFRGGKRGQAIANLQKRMQALRVRSGIGDFKFHDLRRTAASHMTGLGIPRLVVSKILNHAEQGVTAVYDRHSYDPEKRDALSRWDRRVAEIVRADTLAQAEAGAAVA
jgi:integrase